MPRHAVTKTKKPSKLELMAIAIFAREWSLSPRTAVQNWPNIGGEFRKKFREAARAVLQQN